MVHLSTVSSLRDVFTTLHKLSQDGEINHEEPKGESFFMIFLNFLKAKKHKVCPLITVNGETAKGNDH